MVTIRNLGRLGTPMPYQYSAMALSVPERETYGHKLRRLRLELAMTQGEVAKMVGCSKHAISLWECDKRHGNSTEAAELPRRAILLLSARLRRKQKRDGVDTVAKARRKAKPEVVDEPPPPRRLRRA